MPALSNPEIAGLLAPFLHAEKQGAMSVPAELYERLSLYLDLLLRWNARTNLTAIREPAEIVRRHFGESLLLTQLLPAGARTVLDLGSGAGFPGVPMQLLREDLAVTLAESQGKKASFLREVVRSLGMQTTVHGGRAEDLPRAARFDVVALRAVDDMELAIRVAGRFSDRLLLLTTSGDPVLDGVEVVEKRMIPGRREGVAVLCVPRGT